MFSSYIKIFILILANFFAQNLEAQTWGQEDGYWLKEQQLPTSVWQYLGPPVYSGGVKVSEVQKSPWAKEWDEGYWIYTDSTVMIGGLEYRLFYIRNSHEKPVVIACPAPVPGLDPKDAKPIWTYADNLKKVEKDFETWLLIKESDFQKLKKDHYRKLQWQAFSSAITIPFRYRPAIAETPSSTLNSNFQLGIMVGLRTIYFGKVGLSVGGHIGGANQSQNSSNNSDIVGAESTDMFAFTYGAGLVADFRSKMQIGIIVGADHGTGKLGKTYVYQDHPWFAFSLNFRFLEFNSGVETRN